jgi:hypothetical protein
VTFSEDGSGSAGHDVAIVVIGETPYAEWLGDDAIWRSTADIACLNRIGDIPTVVVLVSGRPLMISDRLGDWDAFVAAWLPGTEGDGVAEVLFGEHNFTGTLPHSWPVSIGQVPINVGDAGYDPLYPYGHGLTYDLAPADGDDHGAGRRKPGARRRHRDPGTASDSDGTVTSVEFYEGRTYLGSDSAAPYAFTWTAAADGCYTIGRGRR